MSTAVDVCASLIRWAYLASASHDPWFGEELLFPSHRGPSPLFDVVFVRLIRPVNVFSFRLGSHLLRALSILHGNTYEG